MTKRNLSPSTVSNRSQNAVKLVTCRGGEELHFAEPSIVCAAQHAIDVCDNEEGCARLIEANGKVVWRFDAERPRNSLAQLDVLAQGECSS